jgi:hypothetical protein
MLMKKVAPLILNYNNSKDTIECVSSLLKSDTSPYRIIIVDNKSTDTSFADIKEWLATLSHPLGLKEKKTSVSGSYSQVWAFTSPSNIRIQRWSPKLGQVYKVEPRQTEGSCPRAREIVTRRNSRPR